MSNYSFEFQLDALDRGLDEPTTPAERAALNEYIQRMIATYRISPAMPQLYTHVMFLRLSQCVSNLSELYEEK